jgi:methionyl-tRNA formyltransferase
MVKPGRGIPLAVVQNLGDLGQADSPAQPPQIDVKLARPPKSRQIPSVRCVFFGTPALAVPCLEALTQTVEVVFAVCQPDRSAGRGLQLRTPEVKAWSNSKGLTVIQPSNLKDGQLQNLMREHNVDLGVVLAYGKLLPPDLLDTPSLGCVNLHASLLPRHRGAAPIQWAILAGDSETGVSLMQMEAGLDTGPVLAQHRISIEPRETSGSLTERMSQLCAQVIRLEIPRLALGSLIPTPQEHEHATWAPPIRSADRRLDFERPSIEVDARVRALSPRPGALTTCRGRILRLLETLPLAEDSGLEPGTVSITSEKRIRVATRAGSLEILRAQFEGKKPLSAIELLNGRSLANGDRLGD